MRGSQNGARMSSNLSALSEMPLPQAPDPALDPVAYLRSIHSIRPRSRIVLEKAKTNRLNHFDVDPRKFSETAAYVVSIIKVSVTDVDIGKIHNSEFGRIG